MLQDALDLRTTTVSQVPRTAVYPTLWATCRRHLWHDGMMGLHMSGDVSSDLHVPLVIASCTKLKLGGPVVKVGIDTYLAIDVQYLITEGVDVQLTAIPSRWLSHSV